MITQKGREAKPTILTSVVNALLSVAKAKRALSQIFKLQHCMTVSAQAPRSQAKGSEAPRTVRADAAKTPMIASSG